jgi:hypothetical protein
MWEIDRSMKPAANPPTCGRWTVAVRVERFDHGPAARLTAVAVVGLVVAGALAVFGMPPIGLHSPLHSLGVMDPLCGMTRGSAATMRGDLARAWWYNPASPLVIAGGFVLLARWAIGRPAGLWLGVRVRVTPPMVGVIGLGLIAHEVNQQLHATRLR